VRRVHIERRGEALGDEVPFGEGPCQLDPILGADAGI
jgi:hypothetical protein